MVINVIWKGHYFTEIESNFVESVDIFSMIFAFIQQRADNRQRAGTYFPHHCKLLVPHMLNMKYILLHIGQGFRAGAARSMVFGGSCGAVTLVRLRLQF